MVCFRAYTGYRMSKINRLSLVHRSIYPCSTYSPSWVLDRLYTIYTVVVHGLWNIRATFLSRTKNRGREFHIKHFKGQTRQADIKDKRLQREITQILHLPQVRFIKVSAHNTTHSERRAKYCQCIIHERAGVWCSLVRWQLNYHRLLQHRTLLFIF